MTNQEYLSTISPEDFWEKIKWLQKEYGKRYNDSYIAIIDWLKTERNEENDTGRNNC